jgi:hypothetical protein
MTNILRDQALRLALYLSCVGIDPHVSGASYREYLAQLTPVYCSVPAQLRKEGRRQGRRMIREAGGVEPAASPLLPKPKLAPSITGPCRRAYEKRLKRMLNWGPETPPCLECRLAGVLPKRSWPSREAAEEPRIQQKILTWSPIPALISRAIGISAIADLLHRHCFEWQSAAPASRSSDKTYNQELLPYACPHGCGRHLDKKKRRKPQRHIAFGRSSLPPGKKGGNSSAEIGQANTTVNPVCSGHSAAVMTTPHFCVFQ